MRFRWTLFSLALLLAARARADSVTLTTGETISGTIKVETPTEVTIDIPVSASITDERVIQKAEISKIERQTPDEIAYKQLILIQPNSALSYSSQTYDQILASFAAFEAKYPQSPYLPEIQKLAALFQEEKKHVDAGEIKYLGDWLTRDQAARRQVQIMALQYYGTMQQEATAGNLVPAMQTFEVIEKNYSATRSYPAAVTLAQQICARLQQDLVVRMQDVLADQDQLKKTIAFTAEPEKSNIIAAAKAEQDRDTAVVNAASKSGSKWVPLIPRCALSISTLQGTAASEATRLASIPVETMNESIAKVDAAREAMADGDLKGADALLKAATALWAQNEAAHFWEEQVKAKMPTPTPTPSAKPKPLPTATPKPLPTTAPQPAATPATAAIAATAPPAAAKAPSATPAPPSTTPSADAPPADKPYFMTLPGMISIGGGVLVVVGLVGSYIQKKFRKEPAE